MGQESVARTEISTSIHAIFKRYTDLVEGVALDEAYLDVTENKQNITYASTIVYTEIGEG